VAGPWARKPVIFKVFCHSFEDAGSESAILINQSNNEILGILIYVFIATPTFPIVAVKVQDFRF
jgi:hypothetical protein